MNRNLLAHDDRGSKSMIKKPALIDESLHCVTSGKKENGGAERERKKEREE